MPEAVSTAIVLGVDTQIGLAIVRELGQAGVRVVAVSHDPLAIGLVSRHVWRKRVCHPARGDAWIALLNGLAAELGPCSVIAISEVNLQWLQAQRDHLAPELALAIPTERALRLVLDKQRTIDMAREVGLDTPRSEQPASIADVERLAHDFPFPAVLKWSDPNAVAPLLSKAGLPLEKAVYAYDTEEFMAAMHPFKAIGCWPLVQQYCPGRGLGQFFFMHGGVAIQRFQHLRVAEWPPEGGFSSVCDALPLDRHSPLQERSIALLRRIAWDGVAMVEFRLDEATGSAKLMEINGRFWGSFPLAQQAGAGFAVLAHRAALGLPLRSPPQPREELRCRMVVTEIKRLKRIWLQPGLIRDRQFQIRPWAELRRFLADFVRRGVGYYVWSLSDPLPWLADVGRPARALWRRFSSAG